jgi:hypothetical protein
MDSIKQRCSACKCFIITNQDVEDITLEETLPEPTDGCDKTPTCSCHTGIGKIPRYEVIVLGHSAEREVQKYRNMSTRRYH